MDVTAIYHLCSKESDERDNVSLQEVDEMSQLIINEIQEKLAVLYALLLLEGTIKTDEFFVAKKNFLRRGQQYGYINCAARQDKGTNTFRFYKRVPKGNGVIIRENLPLTQNGFSKHQLHKKCSHDAEYELCIDTEEIFKRLRKDGKTIKNCARLLRTLTVLKRANQNE